VTPIGNQRPPGVACEKPRRTKADQPVAKNFGPVAALLSFDTEEQVIRRANDTAHRLASYFFTRDIGRVWRLAEQLEYRVLGANYGMPSTAQAPFGGVKESGFGREGDKWGIEEFLEIKYVSVCGISKRPEN
jgi:succinate-semialdehyde dehydrogenase/glutarate-semialdehyde dehydrogenase